MRNRQFAVAILLACSAGCMHSANSATVLRPLAAEYMTPLADSASVGSQYVVFADSFTEKLILSAHPTRQLRVAPAGSTLLCPGLRSDGLHGWRVRIHLARITGNKAVGVIEQGCQGLTYASLYELVKQRGVWHVGRALGGTVSQ
jgi:hypothetical protein